MFLVEQRLYGVCQCGGADGDQTRQKYDDFHELTPPESLPEMTACASIPRPVGRPAAAAKRVGA
jgi:hypothetical protein